MAKPDEEYAARLIVRDTHCEFMHKGLPIKGWGRVDKSALLKPNCYLIVEVETRQKHSCTNVLKLWPYLESEPKVTVVLAHLFFQGGKCRDSSRGKLGPWVGQKIEEALGDRFHYRQLVIDRDSDRIVEGLEKLLQSLEHFKLKAHQIKQRTARRSSP
jgi:hypothetical protein